MNVRMGTFQTGPRRNPTEMEMSFCSFKIELRGDPPRESNTQLSSDMVRRLRTVTDWAHSSSHSHRSHTELGNILENISSNIYFEIKIKFLLFEIFEMQNLPFLVIDLQLKTLLLLSLMVAMVIGEASQ